MRPHKPHSQRCDMDCEHCTRPADQCHGGSTRSPYAKKNAHTMRDGKGYMPDAVKTNGRKVGNK